MDLYKVEQIVTSILIGLLMSYLVPPKGIIMNEIETIECACVFIVCLVILVISFMTYGGNH